MQIKKSMTLGQIMNKHPESAEIMTKYGLHCVGCGVAAWETLEQGASAHGMSNEDTNKMLNEINKSMEGKNE